MRALTEAEYRYHRFTSLPVEAGRVDADALEAWRTSAINESVEDERHSGGHDWLYLSYEDGSALRVDNPEQQRGAAHVCILA